MYDPSSTRSTLSFVSDDEHQQLQAAHIIPSRMRRDEWCKYINRRVSLEQAAWYLGWFTDGGKVDTGKLQSEIDAGNIIYTPRGNKQVITVADLINFHRRYVSPIDTSKCTQPHFLERLGQWVSEQPFWRRVFAAIFSLLAVIVGVISQVYPEEVRRIFTPPQTSLTIILDASTPMGRFVGPNHTLWDIALDIAQAKLPTGRYAETESVTVWVERGILEQTGTCFNSHNQLTDGYVSAVGLQFRSLAAQVPLLGEPNPGPALREAMQNVPRFRGRQVNHRAVILTSGANTCSGKSPVEEICEVLKAEYFRWSSWNNANLTHDVTIVDFKGGQVGTTTHQCDVENIYVSFTALDPDRPEESNRELCKTDADLCDQPLFVVPPPVAVATVTPAPNTPTTALPIDTPSVSPGPPPAPTSAPVSSPTPIFSGATPDSGSAGVVSSPPVGTPSQPAEQFTPTPVSTPAFKVRAPIGKRVVVREGCNQGRVVGDIGGLDPSGQQIEALVPSIPGDLLFVESEGCIRVFTGILGEPTRGFPAFVQANEVCAVGTSYDYWRFHPDYAGRNFDMWLRRCTD